MRYVSLFSGVEAASVAWANLGWEPLAFAEVEPFPCAVLAHRFPDVPNLGDVCNIDWEEFNRKHGAVDVLIGGSPCQSFSVAGNREGLQGESRLMYEYIRAVRDLVRASEGRSPRYFIWENVPGCLSSNQGRDFGCLLDQLEECGYCIPWRTLDSQYARVLRRESGRFVGPVPQRRRRVFAVGGLGGPGVCDILFERSCLRGDHPKGREAREALAEHLDAGLEMGDSAGFKWFAGARAKGIGYEDGTSPTLSVSDGHTPAVLTPWDVQSKRVYSEHGTSPTLQAGMREGGGIQPIVLQGNCMTPWDVQSKQVHTPDGPSPTLSAGGSNWAPKNVQPIVFTTANTNANGSNFNEDGASYTLDLANSNAVAFEQNQRDEVRLVGGDGSHTSCLPASRFGTHKNEPLIMTQYGETAGTLTARSDSSPCADRGQNVVCVEECVSDIMFHDDVAPTQRASQHKQPPVICMSDDQRNSAVNEDLAGTLKVGGSEPIIAHLSNGEDVVGTLAARDYKGVGNEYVAEGKVIVTEI